MQEEAFDGEEGRDRLIGGGYVDGECLVELQTLEPGESLEDVKNLLEVRAVIVWYMGNGEVYEVTLEERR